MLSRNDELLEGYLSGRRLSLKTRDNYRDAVGCFTRLLEAPLEEAGRQEFEEWYRRASSMGLAASSIDIYSCRLRKILEYALMGRGLSRIEALAASAAALEGVPVTDLRRESRIRWPGLDMLVARDEFWSLMEGAGSPRVKAMIAILYESACRKGEFLNVRLGDIVPRPVYTELRVYGKTGVRTIPLVRSLPYLAAWLDVHPDKRPRSPLAAAVWRDRVVRISESAPNHALDVICEREGLRKIHPHMLRHTRLTDLARAGLGEYQLKSFAGWTPDSKMAARYIHLAGRAHIPAILEIEGVATAQAEKAPVNLIQTVLLADGAHAEEALT